jgi:replicative DNA helicase
LIFTSELKLDLKLTENIYNFDNKQKQNAPKSTDFNQLGSRVPPHSLDAETAVIGAMMLDRQAIAKVISLLDENSFYSLANKKIFETILNMYEKQINVDLVTLSEELHKSKALETIGGTYYLAEINRNTPTAANVEYHARIIQEKFLKRLLINAAGEILARTYDPSSDALEEIDAAESIVFQIAEKRVSKNYMKIKDLAHETMDMIAMLNDRDGNGITGVPTGLKELDKILGGFQKSDLIIVAGRPSMGKTALALSIARNACLDSKKAVGFFSIEMAAIQLVIRLLSAESKVNGSAIRTGQVKDEEMTRLAMGMGRLADAPFIIDDSPALTIMELRAKARRMMHEHQIEMIVVDYLQLMHQPKAESREREISMISRSLKQIAKELNIPVVALAQLNRTVEARTDKRPMLSDLRESGSIEQDADVVLFVNRPEVYGIKNYDDENQTPTEGTAELIIGKQRNGPIGTARVAYVKDFARFENLAMSFDQPDFSGPQMNEEAPF